MTAWREQTPGGDTVCSARRRPDEVPLAVPEAADSERHQQARPHDPAPPGARFQQELQAGIKQRKLTVSKALWRGC